MLFFSLVQTSKEAKTNQAAENAWIQKYPILQALDSSEKQINQ